MNDEALTLRALRRDDYPAIADMLRRMWYSDPETSPSCARRLAMIDLHHSLDCSDDAVVAQRNGTVAGIITTRIDKRKNPSETGQPYMPRTSGDADGSRSQAPCRAHRSRWHRLRVIGSAMPLLLSGEGRRGLHEMLSLSRIDARLMHGWRSRFGAEVTLLLVDDAARGHGVGRALFDHAMSRFREAGVDRYFLFTDTSCNVGFYEHRGLARLRERQTALRGGIMETFYLYEGRS
ncbi:GNAT family N-acetyltransferase [Bifidobacterium sp. SO1]|uniref:GNAT family N-acetyltransferase n=1 Tax=Bifidobacterium sp. SO1 TaxID=2809029 RepID=UPI001BDCFD36|nr:GNAT family N-acetyltransferase [Bifidobacterium sp. SO1]MBT1161637.1 GNAT family N-acetyltransferase [Bifidobacterium sp. SO1]